MNKICRDEIRRSRRTSLLILAGICLFCLTGCAVSQGITHYFRSSDQFTVFEKDPRIRYEEGADQFAQAVANCLDAAIEKVEARQYAPIPDEIIVYDVRRLSGENLSPTISRIFTGTGK